MGSITDFKTTPSQLVLFIRTDCEFCAQAQDLLKDVSLAEIKTFVIFQSRMEGMLQMRPVNDPPEDYPVLIKEEEIPEVPCLYDPILNQRMMGINSIEKYLEDTGLL